MGQQWKKLGDISQANLTPMLRQYLEAKAESGDSLLFFRMGDFYELFFEDAVEAAELLGIALTSRDAVNKDDRIPMAGVPVRAVDSYLAKAIKAGRTITICEQVEDPKEAKGVVKRAIVRTITPGTVIEPHLLEEGSNNYLAALCVRGDRAGLSLVDITTGEFLAAQIDGDVERTLFDELTRMAPAELLVPSSFNGQSLARLRLRFSGTAFTSRNDDEFDVADARTNLLDQFGLATLKGIGLDDAPEAASCAGAVLSYVRSTQRDMAPLLRLPRRYSPSQFVVLDGNTQRNLELVESMIDKKGKGTLMSVLDRTTTSMGSRKLRHWILHPLLDVSAIRERLDAVEELHGNAELRLTLREILRGIADLERLTARLTSRSANARDVKALGVSLSNAPALRASLDTCQSAMLAAFRDGMDELKDVTGWIADEIIDEPPLALMDGGIMRDGCDPELDRLRVLVRGGRDWIATLQREESERTKIPNLKVGYNKVFGYFIEITRSYAHLVPPDYERKQTLVNAERYITPTLKSREEEIVSADEKMKQLEYDLFVKVRERIANEARRIQATADTIAGIDVLLSLAETASAKNYCKPEIEDGGELRIRDGRHPVVEDLMSRNDFVANDTHLDPNGACMQIVTGPNMAGKSTYLRQVALITLMAQIGSYVPASAAHIDVVDRIFTRVGASDNLVRGESTFMVEMIETANILNSATDKSLLVLDEIGRGTSTFDGISIAWSVAEHIHDRIRAKTLFATHYHELTELANKLEHAKNVNVAVREWGGKVIFLYRIVDGGADHSYGIQVAKLAGLPKHVIERARDILESLESGNTASLGLPQQMYLFGPTTPLQPSAIERELESINPDDLSPREAHELVCHLKHLLAKPRKE
ncbi:MAG: DNA mismatch repair protein MutS [Candidatus Hydrogenedentes bacterium]|nr:DNA mismatch repair protein MutS [Candidatus Hydrogenedentota bacterium]